MSSQIEPIEDKVIIVNIYNANLKPLECRVCKTVRCIRPGSVVYCHDGIHVCHKCVKAQIELPTDIIVS